MSDVIDGHRKNNKRYAETTIEIDDPSSYQLVYEEDEADIIIRRSSKKKNAKNEDIRLASYNHELLPKIRKMQPIKIQLPYQEAFKTFSNDIDCARDLEKVISKDLNVMKDSVKKDLGIEVIGGEAVTISWMLYIEGPSQIDVSATSIRHAILNRRNDILNYIRSAVGTNEDGSDKFALDWESLDKRVFNDYRCIFPIYFPGLCIKLSRNGAHITGPKNVDDFIGVAEFVRGLYTMVSSEDRPHQLKSFTMSMLNVPIKLSFPTITKEFPDRDAIHLALKKAEQEALTLQLGPLWDNVSNIKRCCITDLKYNPDEYAGVNFRYNVHGEKHPGISGNKVLKWPWVTFFDNGKLSIIFTNPKHIVDTIKFIVEFIHPILVEFKTDADDQE